MDLQFTASDIARFWSHIDKTGGHWLWDGGVNKKGYGRFRAANVGWLVHRFAWIVERGNPPDGMLVLHTCSKPNCVRPEHLALGARVKSNGGVSKQLEVVIKAPVRQSSAMHVCRVCGKDFSVQANQVRHGAGVYCSLVCMRVFERDPQRFWEHVDKNGPPPAHYPELGPCWLWVGNRAGKKGEEKYGILGFRGQRMLAHRASWLLTYGQIPTNLKVLHRCDIRHCVNPAHLFIGTLKDNSRDCQNKGRGNHPSGKNHHSYLRPDLVARGERAGNAKLTADKVVAMRARASEGPTVLGAAYGVTTSVAARILKRYTWKHIP